MIGSRLHRFFPVRTVKQLLSLYCTNMKMPLPVFCSGTVIKGFGRGSKQLGIPTANYPEDVVARLPTDIPTGVYYGWAKVNSGKVHKMVMSVGWNPFYKNEKKSMETHILHEFEKDFYGSNLSLIMVGFVREERNFNSLDELISAIHADIKEAETQLELPENNQYKDSSFFKQKPTSDSQL
ncbi:riboflavin kinase-like [Saccoglossus kowalevskii]|uniref:riboflavin kinase n=1 Tax=Saccoglossus kowalevskii TaxID=10224 RepID=A0ABM0GV83_SACKO|nr:PREDICTED: riboflavin kinase-like [Saccoglossus kowalevskii]